MTRLLVDPAADFDDPAAVTITATLLNPGPSVVRTFADVTTDTVVDLPAPDTTEAWRLTIRRPVTTINRWNIASTNPGPIVEERTVHFPDGDPVAWATLTDVDPATLRTTAVPAAAWDAAIAELRAEVDALPTGGGGGGTGFSGAYADLTGTPTIPDLSALVARPATYLDPRTLPDGPLVDGFGNSPFTVNGGALEHTPTVTSNGAAYYQRTLPGPVARIGAIADWDADANGSVALVIPAAPWSDADLGNAGVHATVDSTGFVTVGRFEAGSGVVAAHTGQAADLTGGRHLIEVTLDPRRSAVTVLIDGVAVIAYTDPVAFTMVGMLAVWELYEFRGSADVPARLLALWADVEARVPPAGPVAAISASVAAPSTPAADNGARIALVGSYNTTVPGGFPGGEIGSGAARLAVTVPPSGVLLVQLVTFLDLYGDDNVLVMPQLTYTDGSGSVTGDAISVTQRETHQQFTLTARTTGTPGKDAVLSWLAFQVGTVGAVFRAGDAAGSGYVTALPAS